MEADNLRPDAVGRRAGLPGRPGAVDREGAAMNGAALQVRDLRKSFYAVHALDGVSFSVAPGELVGLIGPNGSGKTTAIDCISGLQEPDSGSVELDGASIFRYAPHRLAQHDVVRTFQGVRVFATLPVRRNLEVAMLGRLRGRQRIAALAHRRRGWPGIGDLIATFGLEPVADMPAGHVSYGQRKLVEFAAACVRRPRLLLLDEPVAAVNPTMANVIRDRILELHRQGTSILLVEHNMEFVLGTCQRVIVLDEGRILVEGAPEDVVRRPIVQEAYFGR
ncbi:MAG: ATP-binding cassette domain-containing protein [Nitriliruptorales bacterium]|nr:ATP-binding cassette domain-containing protein [Nitriliruptorales bacterium]